MNTQIKINLTYQNPRLRKVCEIMNNCDLPSEIYIEDSFLLTTTSKVDEAYISNMKKMARKQLEGDGYVVKKVKIEKIHEDN